MGSGLPLQSMSAKGVQECGAKTFETHHTFRLSPLTNTRIIQWRAQEEGDTCASSVYATELVGVVKEDGDEGLHYAKGRRQVRGVGTAVGGVLVRWAEKGRAQNCIYDITRYVIE